MLAKKPEKLRANMKTACQWVLMKKQDHASCSALVLETSIALSLPYLWGEASKQEFVSNAIKLK